MRVKVGYMGFYNNIFFKYSFDKRNSVWTAWPKIRINRIWNTSALFQCIETLYEQ